MSEQEPQKTKNVDEEASGLEKPVEEASGQEKSMEETSGVLNKEIEETSRDYAAYLNVDMNSELKGIFESVEEMQLRLEEFNSILEMLQANSSKSITENIPRFLELKPHVSNFCKRVDALENFVSKVNSDLVNLEAHLEVAEANLGTSDNKLTMLNPLSYFKKSSEASSATSEVTPQPINIFKTEDYFNPESTEE